MKKTKVDVDELVDEFVINDIVNAGGKGEFSPDSPEKHEYIEISEIDGWTIFHVAGMAKKHDILSPYQRRSLFSLGQSLNRYGRLTTKQASFLNRLLQIAKKEGLDKLGCGKNGCARCRDFRRYDARK